MVRPGAFATTVAVSFTVLLAACGQAGTGSRGVDAPSVVVSEVHWGDPGDVAENEFIEITNLGDSSARIGGWCITGVDFCFEKGTLLPAGAHLATPASAFGSGLSDGGERLELIDSGGRIRDTVSYDDRDPWPRSADGLGDSLHRLLPARSGERAESWQAAPPTPNEAFDPSTRLAPRDTTGLSFSEVHYEDASLSPRRRFVELINAGTMPVDPAGWCIRELDRCFVKGSVAPNGLLVADDARTVTRLAGTEVLTLVRPDGSVAESMYWDTRGLWPARADGHGHSLQRRDPLLRAVEIGNWVSAPPTKGEPNVGAGVGLLPTVTASVHSVSPPADTELRVVARAVDVDSARLVWRVGFGPEQDAPMVHDGNGRLTGTIPGQAAGSLVRYRVVATNARGEGTWPRRGAGENWDGTVVAADSDSPLPVLGWFMPDREYAKAYSDRSLYRDEGYPAVFAWNGEIMDNASVRMKGQQSRGNTKKKWKVSLAPGDRWESSDLAGAVNEFSLHSASTDKSYVREILTSDLQRMSGGTGQQVFPLRLEKNGEFYGLYLYSEQTDGRWRDKQGWSDDTIVFKGEQSTRLSATDLRLPRAELARRYTVKPQGSSHDELVDLILDIARMGPEKRLAFAYERLDIPQIVDTIAVIRVAQHYEVQHKNHLYVLDRSDMRWRFVAIDHDLNFGRRYLNACGSFCDEVGIVDNFEYMAGNQMTRFLMRIPELRAMVDRRTRTLADLYLAPGLVERRVDALANLMRADAALDRRAWGSYGKRQTMDEAQTLLLRSFIGPKREQLLGPDSPLPPAQSPDALADLRVDGLTVTNTGRAVVDLSGRRLGGLPVLVPAGVVLNPGQSVIFETDRIPDAGRPAATRTAPSTLRVWLPPR
jgi:hypothetical protein